MQTLLSDVSEVIDDSSIKLIPGRYALQIMASSEGSYDLSAGTLTLKLVTTQVSTVTGEAITTPLKASLDPSADPLTYDMSIASNQTIHLEFIVAQDSSLHIYLDSAGGENKALLVSCNPINH